MPRRVWKGALVALLLPIVAGCTAGPSTRPAVIANDGPPAPQTSTSPAPVPLPGLDPPGRGSVVWADCDDNVEAGLGEVPATLRPQCASLPVTLDAPDLPGRGSVRLTLLKVGSGPIPLAVVNDINGEPGTVYAARLAAKLPPEMLQRFSLIGMDRRGTGQSRPIRCIPAEVRTRLLGNDPGQPSIEPLLEAARSAGQQCTIELENDQGAMDSWRAAGDLDELRDKLGMAKLHAFGHGEGSRVLSMYATRFPDRTGRIALDGLPDPAPDAVQVLDGVAAGAEATLDGFGQVCAAQGCAVGTDARQAVTSVVDRARSQPFIGQDGNRIGPALVLRAVLAGLRNRDSWPALAEAIAAARSGDGGKLAAFVAPWTSDSRILPSRLDGTLATVCNDTATRLPADKVGAAVADLRTKYPVFGGTIAQQLVWCSPWPVRREPLPPAGSAGLPPILVTSTATDAATPETGTARAAQQMPSAVRVAWQGTGHGAVGYSPCATGAVRGFLLDGVIPKDGTLCPA